MSDQITLKSDNEKEKVDKKQDSTTKKDVKESKETKDESANPLEHMLPEDVRGLIIELSPFNSIYRFTIPDPTVPKGQRTLFELNAFDGKFRYTIPSDFPIDLCNEILLSLRCGTITIAKKTNNKSNEELKEYMEKRIEISQRMDNDMIEARKVVSELSPIAFKKVIDSITDREFLMLCYEVELYEKNRKEFIDIIRKQLSIIS